MRAEEIVKLGSGAPILWAGLPDDGTPANLLHRAFRRQFDCAGEGLIGLRRLPSLAQRQSEQVVRLGIGGVGLQPGQRGFDRGRGIGAAQGGQDSVMHGKGQQTKNGRHCSDWRPTWPARRSPRPRRVVGVARRRSLRGRQRRPWKR